MLNANAKHVLLTVDMIMVMVDPKAASCVIYEIKHSTEVAEKQHQHLIDKEKCKATEWRYGLIFGKFIIYRVVSCDVNGIHYLNVEEYLKSIT